MRQRIKRNDGPSIESESKAAGLLDWRGRAPRTTMEYSDFIRSKSQIGGMRGFEPLWKPDAAFDFQKHLIGWSVRKGKAAIFADCGLGKSLCQLAWSENVVRRTNGRVLILTPLAVSSQTVREGEKFGVAAVVCRDGKSTAKITVANYERLHYFDPSNFIGVVCDESSILKSFSGATRRPQVNRD